MKLYQFPFSPNCQKVVALAHELGLPLELATVDLFKGEARTPAMLAKNPNGKLPILEDGDFVLWESRAMLTYLATKVGRADLAPITLRERAEVERWTSWNSSHFGPAVRKVAFERIVKKLGGLGAPDEAVVNAGIQEFATTASVLEQSLGTKEYLCGRLTIADFDLAPDAALTASCVYCTRQRWVNDSGLRTASRNPLHHPSAQRVEFISISTGHASFFGSGHDPTAHGPVQPIQTPNSTRLAAPGVCAARVRRHRLPTNDRSTL